MQDFKGHIKRVERRVDFLDSKIRDKHKRTNSYDKAELSGLQALLRVARVYEDARGEGGSHVENVLYMVRDVLTEVGEEWESTLDEDTLDRLDSARAKCSEAIELLHRLSDETEEPG